MLTVQAPLGEPAPSQLDADAGFQGTLTGTSHRLEPPSEIVRNLLFAREFITFLIINMDKETLSGGTTAHRASKTARHSRETLVEAPAEAD